MTKEAIQKTLSVKELTRELIEAARSIDWGKVDNTLIPQLEGVNGNEMAQKLLEHVADEDPNVRDVVATALAPLKISIAETRDKVIIEMIGMATTDTQVFPAGRAAVVLLGHRDNATQINANRIEKAIEDFAERVRENGWVAELTEIIPELRAILKT